MKILRKLCSEQVQVLLERMDTHWEEEFYFDDTKWEPVFPGGRTFKYFTKIEQKCIRDTVAKHTAKYKQEKAYASILERAMSPAKTRWEYTREKEGEHVGIQAQEVAKAARPGQILTASAIANQAQQVLEQEYKRAYAAQQSPAPNPYAQANALQNLMGNIQFELKGARSVADVEFVYKKYQMQIEFEARAIEHQKFLTQFAPRGYV